MDFDIAWPLPMPDSDELKVILPLAEHQRIYKYLYDRREDPPTMVEISDHLAEATGKSASQRGRRVRDLYPLFVIDKTPGSPPRYALKARKPKDSANKPVGGKLRAQVLRPQRCAMCGRTPLEDGVKLVVDHKLPQDWGGSNDLENLQPLCEECNGGKKAHFRTYELWAEKIRQAAKYAEPQRRIGELLLAFGTDEWIRSDLIEIVASAIDFQEDWQRRMRDLRYIGWDYEHRKRSENGRVRTYYRLIKSAPWPDNIASAISAEYEARQQGHADESIHESKEY